MKKCLLLFLFFFFPLSAAHTSELTLQNCIDLAIENNSGLKAYETDIVASDEDVRISRTRFFPSLKLKGDYTLLDKSDVITFKRDSLGPSIPPQDVKISAENRSVYSLSLFLEQSVFTGGNLTHSFRKFRILNEEAQHNFARQKAFVILAVKEAFYVALKDRFQRETLEKMVESKKERLRAMRERHEEGYVPREDLLTAETDFEASEFGLYKIQSREQFDLSKLKKIIYYQSGEEVSLKADPLNFSLAASLQEVKETALANNEDIKMSRKNVKAAGEDVSIAKGDLFPKTSVKGGYTMQTETNIARPNVWMFAAQVEWPIFEWNRTRSEVRKAEAKKMKTVYEHEDLVKSTLLHAEDVWREVREKEREIEFRRKNLMNSEDKSNIAIDRYREKVIKLAELIESEAEFITAYNEYISTITDLDIALARLEASTFLMPDKWLIKKEVYRPDLTSISKKIEELTRGQNEPLKDKKIPKYLPEKKEPEGMQSDSANVPVAIAVEMKSETPSRISYAIQVGAVKKKQEAEKIRKIFSGAVEEERIRIHKDLALYKVRIVGFKDKDEAAKFAHGLGINDFLVIRSTNGR